MAQLQSKTHIVMIIKNCHEARLVALTGGARTSCPKRVLKIKGKFWKGNRHSVDRCTQGRCACWRQTCIERGESPARQGAVDKTFDLGLLLVSC
eukprot:151048-Amphidinium_carterae.1